MSSPNNSSAKASAAFLLSIVTLALAFVAAWLSASDPMFRAMMNLSRQADLLSQKYVGAISPEKAFTDAWSGMQQKLPFRVELVSDTDNLPDDRSLQDWGLTLSLTSGSTSVVAVAQNSPFATILQSGDRVIGVGSETAHLLTNLRQYLSGGNGDSLLLRFERNGAVDSVKAAIPAPADQFPVSVARLEQIAYCAIHVMSDHLSESIADSLKAVLSTETRGVIVDLRYCRDGSAHEVEKTAKVFLDLESTLPMVLLVDQSTGEEGVLLAMKILKRGDAISAGSNARLFNPATEVIPLRSGGQLHVYKNERNASHFYDDDSLDTDSLRNVLKQNATEAAEQIEPQIICEPPQLSGLVFDLAHRGYLLDFVAPSSYQTLPPPESEGELFNDFLAFLRLRNYAYDPVGSAFHDLETNARRPDMRPAIDGIRSTLQAQPLERAEEHRSEIIALLLVFIQQVKIGGEPSMADRLRLDDYCLQAAVAYLKGRQT